MSFLLRMKHPWTAKWPMDIDPEHDMYAQAIIRTIEEFLGARCDELVIFFRLKSDEYEGCRMLTCALDTKISRETQRSRALEASIGMICAASGIASRAASVQSVVADVLSHVSGMIKDGRELQLVPELEKAPYQGLFDDECDIASVQVFDADSLQSIVKMSESKEKHVHEHSSALLARLKDDNGFRLLSSVPDSDAMDALNDQFPNFGEAYEALLEHAILGGMGDRVMRIRPILFVGPPGVGKTKFITSVAKMLGAPHKIINVSSLQSESVLAGSELHWGNTRPGEVFNMIINGKYANPVFMLDEIDKISGRDRSPLAALFHLLEKDTARKFEDLSYPGFTFDASHISWFAAANTVTSVDPAILSRFRVVEIKAHTREQTRLILQYMYDELIREHAWGRHMGPTLGERALDALEAVSPRDAIRAIQSACAHALAEGRADIEFDDINPRTSKHAAIGFVTT